MKSDTSKTSRESNKLSPEIYLHLAFFLAALFIIVMSFAMSVAGTKFVYLPGALLPMPESCTSKMLLGIDCPGCGMTRAFISISHGQFVHAWNFNPASFVAYLFVAVQLPWQILQMWRIWQRRPPIDNLWIYFLPVVMVVAMISQWLVRIVS